MKHLVGRLIGKQGRYVSFLKQTSGAKIYISTLPYSHDFQICHIEGEISLFSLIPSLLVVIRWARVSEQLYSLSLVLYKTFLLFFLQIVGVAQKVSCSVP